MLSKDPCLYWECEKLREKLNTYIHYQTAWPGYYIQELDCEIYMIEFNNALANSSEKKAPGSNHIPI